MSINSSISSVRSILLNPQENAPTLDQLFSHLTAEYQNFINTLDSTNLPWLYNSITVDTSSNGYDYLVPVTPGKVLFVTGLPQNNIYGPISLEFADLADVSSGFYPYAPLDYGFSPDFNELINFPFSAQIAFYRKDNDLWFRLAPYANALTSVNIVFSTGDWLQNLTVENTAVLANHHHLVHTRAAMNLLPGAEWKKDENYNQLRRVNLAKSLEAAEERYATQFMYARRNLTADETNVRPSYDDGFGAFL